MDGDITFDGSAKAGDRSADVVGTSLHSAVCQITTGGRSLKRVPEMRCNANDTDCYVRFVARLHRVYDHDQYVVLQIHGRSKEPISASFWSCGCSWT